MSNELNVEDKLVPTNAFLIIKAQIYPMDRAVINIGRRNDNHLPIDDQRVSRAHAQLRAIKGRYMIVDLNSTGGTFVNGQRITQSVLYSGDSISLAGFPILYVQDSPELLKEASAYASPDKQPEAERSATSTLGDTSEEDTLFLPRVDDKEDSQGS